jgi:hypothetical protein
MSILPNLAPLEQTAPLCPAPITPAEAAKALRFAHAVSRRQWHGEGYRLDLTEYQDAALDALTACLARYTPTRGIPLSTYAYPRIQGAVRRAWLRYRTWHELRGGRWFSHPPDADTLRPAVAPFTATVELWHHLATLPPEAQVYAGMVLAGHSDAAYAQARGLTSARWVKARVQRWRAALQEEMAHA